MSRRALALALALLLSAGLPALAKERDRLRVVSWNVWGLPWGISDLREERVAAIGPALVALKPDLVCLQEVWVAEDGEAIAAALAEAGLTHFRHESAGLLGSGLLIASRYPLRGERFEAFELTGKLHKPWHGDAWARKGVLEVKVETPLGTLVVATTHLHASYGSREYLPTQLAQAAQLGHFLGDLGRNPPERADDGALAPLLVCGDLNARREGAPFELLCGVSGLSAPAEKSLGIDWVLSRGGGALQLEVRRVRHALTEEVELPGGELAPLSDHPAVVCELRLRRAKPRGVNPALARVTYAAAAARARPLLEEARQEAEASARRWRNRGLGLMVLGGLFMWLVYSKHGPKRSKGKCGVSCLSFVFLHLAVWAVYLGVVYSSNQARGLQGALNRLPEPAEAPR